MYKCKECGTEFDIKPDFCDCGNDTFDLVEEIVEEKQEAVESPLSFDDKVFENEIKENIETKSFNSIKTKQINVDIPSLIFFVICLILSGLVIFYMGNPTEKNLESTTKQESDVKVSYNIPSIEKLWDNTPPQIVDSVENNMQTQPQTQQIIDKIQPQKASQSTKINKSTKNNFQNKQVQQISKPKPQQQAKSQQQVTPKPVVKKSNPQELAYYKKVLRDEITSKIDFTNILGDGECIVSFKISSSGKLIDRKFLKQSDNGMLNDEVYRAMMSVPTFRTPPTSYNNETLKLTVRFYGGGFEVYLN